MKAQAYICVAIKKRAQNIAIAPYSMVIAAAPVNCSGTDAKISGVAKGKITAVGSGYIVVGTTTVQVPTCTQVSWNGATAFAVGQRAEYKGYINAGTTVAMSITIN